MSDEENETPAPVTITDAVQEPIPTPVSPAPQTIPTYNHETGEFK